MKYLLSRKSLAIIARLATERTLCAFDFDGTLAAIVVDPERAALRRETCALLNELASLYPCIVVSGRAREDVLEKLRPLPLARIIGNHGADIDPAAASASLVSQWKTVLEASLDRIPGLWIEDKGLSLALHYRLCTDKRAARRHILAHVQTLPHARVVGGKLVVNVVNNRAPNKGVALAGERDRLRCNWVLYVGDDENDEDAFALEGNLIAVRIGRNSRSRATYYLKTQAEIDQLMRLLIDSRRNLPARS